MQKSETAGFSISPARPAVAVDEHSGEITIAIMAHGLTEIVLTADGDVQYQGRSIVNDTMPFDGLFLDGDR